MREVKEVDYLFSTIKDTKVVLMAGNHDAMIPGSFYTDYRWSENVVFLSAKNIERVSIRSLAWTYMGIVITVRRFVRVFYDNVLVEGFLCY